MTPPPKTLSKQRSERQEKRIAAVNGGRVQPGSGSGQVHRNDVKTDRFLIEAKCRARLGAKQITIKLEALRDNFTNALAIGKLPVLTFELGGVDYYLVPDLTWHEVTGNG